MLACSSEGETLNHPEDELAAATPPSDGLNARARPHQLVTPLAGHANREERRPPALSSLLLLLLGLLLGGGPVSGAPGLFSRSGGFTDFMININTQLCEWGIY